MKQEDIEVFIHGTENYFREVSGEPASLGIPFIKGKESLLSDYTGYIGISGTRKGGLYITCSKEMLSDLAKAILQSDDVEDETLIDMIGEMANTIAGNARTVFGSEFMISVPSIFAGKPEEFRIILSTPVLVLPIEWKSHQANLVIGIE